MRGSGGRWRRRTGREGQGSKSFLSARDVLPMDGCVEMVDLDIPGMNIEKILSSTGSCLAIVGIPQVNDCGPTNTKRKKENTPSSNFGLCRKKLSSHFSHTVNETRNGYMGKE